MYACMTNKQFPEHAWISNDGKIKANKIKAMGLNVHYVLQKDGDLPQQKHAEGAE